MSSYVTPTQLHYLPAEWTDHCLLTVDFFRDRTDLGPGVWGFNPTLLLDESFLALLDVTTDLFFEESTSPSGLSVQEQWESFKQVLKCTAKKYSKSTKTRTQHTVSKLQKERQCLSAQTSGASQPSPSQTNEIHRLEKLIDKRTRQATCQHMLRSATRWLDQGEQNTKYFYRVIKERQTQQTIQRLRCSTTGDILESNSDLLREATSFYQRLYTPDTIDPTAVEDLLAHIPSDNKLSADQAQHLLAEPTNIDLVSLLEHTPHGKSPGLDGIPFEVYRYLSSTSAPFFELFLQILKDALRGIFPESWQHTRMVLLFKKGDPSLLANWRPLSLINTDAKLFTKLLANRFNRVLPRLINPYQTGFLPNRLISDNGWWNQVIMANLRSVAPSLPQVAVLLDQEKAYDRVHPEYLRRVLVHFGFPDTLVSCLSLLFFGTQISVSINGWLGSPIPQLRGLRQGDPLSPLLFNLAFEPLLRSILSCPSLAGVSLAPVPLKPSHRPSPLPTEIGLDVQPPTMPQALNSVPPPIKLLSYADDLEVFLTHPSEWPVLLDLLGKYGRASNARVNLQKTVLLSLSGVAHADWLSIAASNDITWHDASSPDAVRYLGYPLYHNSDQLASFLSDIKVKIIRQCACLRARHLSIRGAGLAANSMILSRLWHILRVIPAPRQWLKEIKSIVRKFILPFWPAPSWSILCLPRRFGGVGLVDIEDQAVALHLVYLQRLLQRLSQSDFVSPWLVHSIQLYTGHTSILPVLLYPDKYRFLFGKLPLLDHFCKLLCRLPPLTMSPDWSTRWFADLPLSSVLIPVQSVSNRPSSVDVASLSLKHLLSDLFTWSPSQNCFYLRSPLTTKRQAIARELQLPSKLVACFHILPKPVAVYFIS